MQPQILVFISAFATGNEGAIHAYLIELETGQLTLVQRTADVEQPFFMAVSPDKKTLYTNHSPGTFGGESHEQIAAYRIEGNRGQLKLLNRQSTRGSATCHCSVDATGRTLVVANYATGSVAAFPIEQDGRLHESSTLIQHQGASIDPERQTGPHAHCALISPDNRFVLSADLGLDQILVYRLDGSAGQLSPAPQPLITTARGAGPRHLAFHPSSPYVYAINELDNTVTMYDYDANSGELSEQQTLTTLPEHFVGDSFCADLKITPDGRWLYGTNRGHDSIVTYRIGDDGRLTCLGMVASRGEGPQNLAITPDGKWLLCANMPGKNVAVFRIDSKTGGLTPSGKPVDMPNPSCILIL